MWYAVKSSSDPKTLLFWGRDLFEMGVRRREHGRVYIAKMRVRLLLDARTMCDVVTEVESCLP